MSQPLSKEELVKRMQAGEIATIVEWRSHKAERGTMRNPENGQVSPFVSLTHNCEVPGGFLAIRERVPDNFDPDKYVAPFKKGDLCAAFVTYFGRSKKGSMIVSGTLHPLKLS